MEHVRKRPGMYIGGTDSKALHHLIYEVVDNSIDEALAGRCDHILVTLYDDDIVSVQDNGGGIPVGINPSTNKPTVEGVMTEIGMGGKFGTGAYKVSGGLHGVGVSAVNALSTEMRTNVFRDGFLWEQIYKQGVVATKLKKLRALEPGEHSGTKQTFHPDFTILEHNSFNFDTLAQRFREMAFVTRRVNITLKDERKRPIPHETTFYFEGGLYSYVRYLNRNRRPLHDPVYLEKDIEISREGKEPIVIGVEVAFQYNDSANVVEMAFANTINTPDGGTHLTGLRSAITGVINRYARKASLLKDKEPNFSGSDTMEGITAIVSVKHPD
ncbi:MAG: DNA topoisomerase IV subunit B, partial [Anaerolineae bacterium]|nr:DNA topoisomerase IV subunit B [Anaerolineae bacterium]